MMREFLFVCSVFVFVAPALLSGCGSLQYQRGFYSAPPTPRAWLESPKERIVAALRNKEVAYRGLEELPYQPLPALPYAGYHIISEDGPVALIDHSKTYFLALALAERDKQYALEFDSMQTTNSIQTGTTFSPVIKILDKDHRVLINRVVEVNRKNRITMGDFNVTVPIPSQAVYVVIHTTDELLEYKYAYIWNGNVASQVPDPQVAEVMRGGYGVTPLAGSHLMPILIGSPMLMVPVNYYLVVRPVLPVGIIWLKLTPVD